MWRLWRSWRHGLDVIVTWRHRWRYQSTRRRHFPIGHEPLNRLISEIYSIKVADRQTPDLGLLKAGRRASQQTERERERGETSCLIVRLCFHYWCESACDNACVLERQRLIAYKHAPGCHVTVNSPLHCLLRTPRFNPRNYSDGFRGGDGILLICLAL